MKQLSIGLLLLLFFSQSHGTEYIVCAQTGKSSGEGTPASPFLTIQQAAEVAQPGDIVSVKPGIYRERVAPPRGGTETAPIHYRSTERHQAIIRGSDVWQPDWTAEDEVAPIWSGSLSEKLFTDDQHIDGANPFTIAMSATPWGRDGRPEADRGYPGADPDMVYTIGQVFVDSQIYRQVPYPSELYQTPASWWYDRDSARLHIHFAEHACPRQSVVEISTRRRIFAPHLRGLRHIEVDGFIMEHCANQYPCNFWLAENPEWQQAGALGTRSGRNWHIHDNIIRHANSIGIDLGLEGHPDTDIEKSTDPRDGSAGYHIVRDNYILHNGAAGTASFGGRNLIIQGNVVVGNNALHFAGKKRWESAGIKLHTPHHSKIHGNYIAHNQGKWGLWLDQGAGKETQISNNLIIGHGVGIDFEIGMAHGSMVSKNYLIDNEVGISARCSGGIHASENLILGCSDTAIVSSIDPSRTEPWSAADLSFRRNIVVGSKKIYRMTTPDAFRSGPRFFEENLYQARHDQGIFEIKGDGQRSFRKWQAYWTTQNGDSGADKRSQLIPDLSYSLDTTTLRLTLSLPHECRCFPELEHGDNKIELWSGIPIQPQ